MALLATNSMKITRSMAVVEELTVTNNGTYVPGTGVDGFNPVNVSVAYNSQEKTVSPSTSSQEITPDSGYEGLSKVTVNAMPSGTEGTPVAAKGTVSNHSVAITPSVINQAGYIAGGTKTGTAVSVSASELVSGTKNVTANGIEDVTNYQNVSVNVQPDLQAKSVIPGVSQQVIEPDNGYDGLSKVTIAGDADLIAENIKKDVNIFGITGNFEGTGTDTSDATATANDILLGETAYALGVKLTGTIPSKAAQTYTPGTTDQTISSGQYLSGNQTIEGDANLVPANIAAGVTIFGVTGEHSGGGTMQQKTITPSAQTQDIYPDSGYDGLSKVTVNGDADLVPENIKSGVNIFGVAGTLENREPFYKINGYRYGGKGNNRGWTATVLWNYAAYKVVSTQYSEVE